MKLKKEIIELELFEEDAPNTAANFEKLIEEADFTRINFPQSNFVIQGGCPNGNGTGGPGYTIK